MAGLDRPISIGPQRTDILAAPEPWRALFDRQHHIAVPDLIDPAFLPALLERCERATYERDDRPDLYNREAEAPQRVGMALNMLMTRAPFLRWVEAATGAPPLVRCEGRLARMHAGGGDVIDWHDDRLPARRLAVVLNLSNVPYAGGAFQLRRKGETDLIADYRHEHAGTALIFSVDPALEHRVLPLASGGPRRVFSGWFMAADSGLPPLDVIQ